MLNLAGKLDLDVVLDLLDEGRRRLVVFKAFRREDNLVDVLCLVHLDESLVVNR